MCTPCADRTIAPVPGGVAVCTPCEEGYIEVGNTKCEICPAGTCYLLNECEPSFAGLFQANPGQTFCIHVLVEVYSHWRVNPSASSALPTLCNPLVDRPSVQHAQL
jgi:hypothetical protein